MELENTVNGKMDYGLALFGNITQDVKTATSEEHKNTRTQENDKSRPKEQKNKRTKESKKTRNKEAKSSRLAVNVTMVDDTIMAIRKRAIKMKAKTWMLIDEAVQEYLKNYTAQSKEVRKSRYHEVKNSGKKRHPANITMVEDTKTAIWLLAIRENVSPWVLIEESLSLFLERLNAKNSRI